MRDVPSTQGLTGVWGAVMDSPAPFAFRKITSTQVHPKFKVQSHFLFKLLVLRSLWEYVDLCLVQVPGTRITQNISGPQIKVCQLHLLHSSINWSFSRMSYWPERIPDRIQASLPHLLFHIFLSGKKKKNLGLASLGRQELTDTLSKWQETSQPLQWTFREGTATENVIHFDDSFLMRARTS